MTSRSYLLYPGDGAVDDAAGWCWRWTLFGKLVAGYSLVHVVFNAAGTSPPVEGREGVRETEAGDT